MRNTQAVLQGDRDDSVSAFSSRLGSRTIVPRVRGPGFARSVRGGRRRVGNCG